MTTAVDKWPAAARLLTVAAADHLPTAPTPPQGTRPRSEQFAQRSWAKYGCLSARPRVRCLCPPGKTQHLLPKSVFDRPGFDRWNLASTTFADAGPMVRIRFPPAWSLVRTGLRPKIGRAHV